MRTLTKEQTFHYILSYRTSTLVYWYNGSICDPFGDYREQTIRDFSEEEESKLKSELSIETLMAVGKNPATIVEDCKIYICLTGGDKPYIVTFNKFEEFLNKMTEEDREGFLEYLCENPELLDELEICRIDEEKRWAELDKKERE